MSNFDFLREYMAKLPQTREEYVDSMHQTLNYLRVKLDTLEKENKQLREEIYKLEKIKKENINMNPFKISLITNPYFSQDNRRGNIKLKGKKVFANEKVTILRVGDKKFIAKNTDEVYDLEKGIMMALLKSEGYTYQDIKQLMDRARPVSEINKK